MLRALIEKEIRDLTGSTKFVYTFAVSAILILLAFYSGAVGHKQNIERWEASRAQALRELDGVTDWLRVNQHRIFLPPEPLAALVNGVSNDISTTTTVAGAGEVTSENSRYNEEPIFAIFRFLDLGFIFQVVLSLFAILLGYDVISGEKERGTLRLCLSNAVSRPVFLLGKFIGSYAVLTVSLLIPIVLGCLLLPALGVYLSNDEWLRLGTIVLCGLLFFGAFLSLAIFVSASTRRPSSSFLLLLVIWVGSVLILPQAAVVLAGRAVNVPSVDEVGFMKTSYAHELWRDFREDLISFKGPQGGEIGELMAAFNNHMDSLTQAREDKMSEFSSRVNEERANREDQRAAVALGLARVSPAVALTLATTELAGSSPDLKREYYDQAMAYQPILSDFLFEKTGLRLGRGMVVISQEIGGEAPQPIDPTEMPAFRFRQPPFVSLLTTALPDIGLLSLFNVFFLAAAVVAFNRYDPR